mgnify:CR=1 FL=1
MIKFIVWFALIDLPLALLRVLVVLTGPLVVTVALPFARNNRLPQLFAWWDNPDYGIKGNEAYLTNEAYNPLIRWSGKWPSNWYWLAIRNPANGLTQSRLFSLVQRDADELNHWGKAHIDNGIYGWQFLWAVKGWRPHTGFYAMVPYCPWFDFEFRIGFKILPREPDRTRRVGMTFIINPFKRAARR